MNTPNKLTILRMCLIPVFLMFMVVQQIPNSYLFAAVVFVIASLTDLLDGHIARKYHLVTDFGKFMDPLADKLLVTSAMIMFVEAKIAPAVIVFLIIARELTVTALRLIAAPKGIVIAADRWGKYKTVSQMIWIVYGLLMLWFIHNWQSPIPDGVITPILAVYYVLFVIVVVLTVFSGINYLWKNREVLRDVE